MTNGANAVLDGAAEKQAMWSATADELKVRIGWGRVIVLILSVAGAILETAAGTVLAGTVKAIAAWAGAACLALIPVFSSRFLGRAQTDAWTRARSVSEAFKAASFKFRTAAAPYDDPATAEQALDEEIARLDEAVDDIRGETGNVRYTPKSWSRTLTVNEFIEQRVRHQADSYYRPKADEYKRYADRFRNAEFGLALLAGALGAAAGAGVTVVGINGREVELAAWVAVITTIAGALTTHAMAASYDRLGSTYLATATRLDALARKAARQPMTAPSGDWSKFVDECENAISTENESWKAVCANENP